MAVPTIPVASTFLKSNCRSSIIKEEDSITRRLFVKSSPLMVNIFLIEKQQKYPIFGRFNALYGDKLANNCPPLNKFQIDILTVDEYRAAPGVLPVIEIDEEKDAFACSSDLQENDAAFTKAGIIFNQTCIDRLGLSDDEQFAAIAHEIGHIIYRFSNLKQLYPGPQGQELFADKITSEIGLGSQLFSVIQKYESSGWFTDSLSRFGMRKIMLSSFNDDSITTTKGW